MRIFLVVVALLTLTACTRKEPQGLIFPGEEKHLINVKQLTFCGENAEAYFSRDGEWLTFQSQRDGYPCDQQYVMRADGSELRKVSTGTGRVTCGYFFGGNKKKVVFTSTRDGDLDLYIMNTDGTEVKRVTTDLGYDGGAFFSHDGKRLIYRAYHPKTEEEKNDYLAKLKEHKFKPSSLELFIIDIYGKNKKQITDFGKGTFAPFMFPNDKRVIFASSKDDPKGRAFDLFAIDLDGTNLERITFSGTFDSFPMFSPDGKKLVWGSNRNGKVRGETNIFIADGTN